MFSSRFCFFCDASSFTLRSCAIGAAAVSTLIELTEGRVIVSAYGLFAWRGIVCIARESLVTPPSIDAGSKTRNAFKKRDVSECCH